MNDVKILVVDDVKIVTDFFKRELNPEGFEVDSALTGAEALEKCTVKRYDIVFIDLFMPGMDGVETCRKLKEISPWSVLIFMTGNFDQDPILKEIEFMKAGGRTYFLYKPFSEGEIIDTVKKAISEDI